MPNDDLSQQRADAVAHKLRSLLGSSVTVDTEAKGQEDPIAPNTKSDGSDNPAGRQQNRRAAITVM